MDEETTWRVREFVEHNASLLGAGALTLAGAAVASLYLSGRPEPIEPPLDLNKQSVLLDGEVSRSPSPFPCSL
jgi:hypothetical protein